MVRLLGTNRQFALLSRTNVELVDVVLVPVDQLNGHSLHHVDQLNGHNNVDQPNGHNNVDRSSRPTYGHNYVDQLMGTLMSTNFMGTLMSTILMGTISLISSLVILISSIFSL